MELHDIFETLMIVSFGVSWPLSIIRSIRSKSTKGKSLLFMCFIAFDIYVDNIKADVAYIQSCILVLLSQYHHGVDGYRIVLQESTI